VNVIHNHIEGLFLRQHLLDASHNVDDAARSTPHFVRQFLQEKRMKISANFHATVTHVSFKPSIEISIDDELS
jgi:hypothetical protein